MRTPAGRCLGRKPDSADPRDFHYRAVHASSIRTPFPRQMDLQDRLPEVFDQGSISSCGANAGAALMSFLFPRASLFSRLQIYANVRTMEDDFNSDDGVETRDVLKSLTTQGAGAESQWPYLPAKMFEQPPPILPACKATSYSRLISSDDYLGCIADGFPFILGFNCFSSFDGPEIAKNGIMTLPDPKREIQIGGHDVLVVGYNLRFKQSERFRNSGIDPSVVEDEMLFVRNSWGIDWGIGGHFHMPLSYALNPSTGGDAWTARV